MGPLTSPPGSATAQHEQKSRRKLEILAFSCRNRFLNSMIQQMSTDMFRASSVLLFPTFSYFLGFVLLFPTFR